jgi:hypothetical protein
VSDVPEMVSTGLVALTSRPFRVFLTSRLGKTNNWFLTYGTNLYGIYVDRKDPRAIIGEHGSERSAHHF